MSLQELDKKNIWHPFTSLTGGDSPIVIESAAGIYLHTADGRKIIDGVSSWWVNLHGHSNPVIAKAVAEQAKVLEHVIFAGFTHRPAVDLSENLLKILPKNQSKIFFSDNGSTAVEVALKMAFQFWHNQGVKNKKKVIAIEGSYHGDTFGSMSVGARGPFNEAFEPFLFDVLYIDFPTLQNEDKVLRHFTELLNNGDVGAFIFEPLVQGAAGMRMYSPQVLDLLLQAAETYNVVTIADEVFTGFGRTGKLFASHYLQRQPDILAVSKGITGGTLPLGVTSCNAKIVSAFNSADPSKIFFHGHSYTANPIACAAANASYEILMSDSCQLQIQEIGRQHMAFRKKTNNHPNVQDIRCLGTILAIELRSPDATSYFNPIRKKISTYFLERNVLLRPLGNVIYILPPYIITAGELNTVYECIEAFLDEI